MRACWIIITLCFVEPSLASICCFIKGGSTSDCRSYVGPGGRCSIDSSKSCQDDSDCSAAPAPQPPAPSSCSVDLTTKGLPICVQDCQNWCWATVISEFQEYFRNREALLRGTNITPQCVHDECTIVSETIEEFTSDDCCAKIDPMKPGHACHELQNSSYPMYCGSPARLQMIVFQLGRLIPGRQWAHMQKPPSEQQLQTILVEYDSPVGRSLLGHIDAVVGCRPCQGGRFGCPKGSGGTEYRVIDSLMLDGGKENPQWLSYSNLLNTTKAWKALKNPPWEYAVWKETIYSPGTSQHRPAERAALLRTARDDVII